MKKIILLTVFLTSSLVAFAQQDFQEVVYLKNGSVLRGTIIEQIPNKSLKIQLSDGSVFVYEIDMVEKITKEPIYNSPYQRKQSTYKDRGYEDNIRPASTKDKGYEGNIYLAYGRGLGDYGTSSMQVIMTHGGRLNSHFAMGLSTGLKLYFENDNIAIADGVAVIIPVLANFKINFLKGNVTPFISESIGAHIYANDPVNDISMGLNEHISFGVSFKSGRKALDLSMGYEWLPMEIIHYNYNYNYNYSYSSTSTSVENVGGLTFGVTFTW
jgi:hypothetical protein